MLTAVAQYAYAVLVARRGLFVILALALLALMVGMGAALEFAEASARPLPGTPVTTCKPIYGPGGNVRYTCWTITG